MDVKEIIEKFKKIISETLLIEPDRISICSVISENHVIARVELRDAKFVDAFNDKLLMYTQYDEIPVSNVK